ncbi:hypothetical protein F5J12DRAFT_970772 [Pisolithus orientalis]|uniref:uncharacterized protein n=1 Tax=Pisolithus orientalis TaxID=936130 RepID=UPI002224FC9D|nr:uncharacterized protein F5J12DRAFT_970772 [Pisolithus orientalis]KAI5987947.1 hypothetical protein F5J12DRAFT_970772 [Pisolithus orientalis]
MCYAIAFHVWATGSTYYQHIHSSMGHSLMLVVWVECTLSPACLWTHLAKWAILYSHIDSLHRWWVHRPMSSVVASPCQLDNAEVSIPLNTSFVGGTVSHVQLQFAVNTSFEDFFSCICAKMDLDPKEAQLGYKYHADHVHDPPCQLSNAQQLAEAFEHSCHLLKCTWVWEVVLEIHNLVNISVWGCHLPGTDTFICQCKPSKAGLATCHHQDEGAQASAVVGSENDNNQELATSMSFAAEFHKLKEHLKCAKHFTGNATYDHPPESNLFNHTPTAQSAPVIHVHLPNTGQLSGSCSGQEPSLTMQYLTGPAPDEDDVFAVYPSISDALHQMHKSMPLLNMPQYEENLISHGIAYVNTVSGILEDFFVDVVACQLAWRARKGKERAADPSDSDKENEDSNASVWCGHTPEALECNIE